jgi:hypothetical protein
MDLQPFPELTWPFPMSMRFNRASIINGERKQCKKLADNREASFFRISLMAGWNGGLDHLLASDGHSGVPIPDLLHASHGRIDHTVDQRHALVLFQDAKRVWDVPSDCCR